MAARNDRLALALLLLRLGVFAVLFVWTMDKFFTPVQAASIYLTFYAVRLGRSAVYVLGALELCLVFAFATGVRKRWSRALVLVLVGASAMAPGRFYLHPFQDHVLLYFASLPLIAAAFTLYYLRDHDIFWTLPAPKKVSGTDPQKEDRLPLALFLLRVGIFLVFLMWTMDKFFNPTQGSRILAGFYHVKGVDYVSLYFGGVLELALILSFLVGFMKRLSYGLVMIFHAASTLAPGRLYLHPFREHTLLFLAAWPMLAACFALYFLRAYDLLGVVPHRKHTSQTHLGASKTEAGTA